MSTHRPLQLTSPPLQVAAQLEATQATPDAQAWPQLPQSSESLEVSTQAPPQIWPLAQPAWQLPAAQTWPVAQPWPQTPQLRLSVAVSVQLWPQRVSLPQLCRHWPDWHD